MTSANSEQTKLINSVSIEMASDLIFDVICDSFERKKIPGNIIMLGAPGTAKSASVNDVAKRLTQHFGKECYVIDIRLSDMEAADVQGIPYVAKEGIKNGQVARVSPDDVDSDISQMFFSTPGYFPEANDGRNYILFCDELTNAPVHVQHAAYRLILDRTCQNGTKLPDNVAIVAAGNRQEDKTGAKALLPAAANRFALHLVIDTDLASDEFLGYAMNAGWDRTVVGYMAYRRGNINRAPNGKEGAFPTQRSWDFANGHVQNSRINASDSKLRIMIAGAVGNSVATDFMAFREHYGLLPDWNKIRTGEVEYEIPAGDEGLKYAIASSLASEIIMAMYDVEDSALSKKYVDNLCGVFKQVPTEMKVVTFKMMRSQGKDFARVFMNHAKLKEIFHEVSSKMR